MAIARRSKNKFIIDSFLLSCRIFGRQVENALLKELIRKVKKQTQTINGIYNKSKKNKEFSNFFIENRFIKKTNKNFEMKITDYKYKKNQLFKIKYEKN